jgi:hypothetical protein
MADVRRARLQRRRRVPGSCRSGSGVVAQLQTFLFRLGVRLPEGSALADPTCDASLAIDAAASVLGTAGKSDPAHQAKDLLQVELHNLQEAVEAYLVAARKVLPSEHESGANSG